MLSRYGIGVRVDGKDVGPVVVAGGTIDYGRMSIFEQPEPPQCEITFMTKAGAPQLPELWPEFGYGDWSTASGFVPDHDAEDVYVGGAVKVYIGAPLWISVTTDSGFSPGHDTQDVYDGAEHRRFTGKIMALDYSTDALTVTAVADIEQWFRTPLLRYTPGKATRGISIVAGGDVTRAQWAANMADPQPLTLHTAGTDGAQIAALQVDDFTCVGNVISDVATDADALFYADREGRVWYRSRNAPRAPVYEVPWSITDHDIEMSLELGTIENMIYLSYVDSTTHTGVPVMGEASVVDNASIALYGQRTGVYESQLWGSSSAQNRAATILEAQRAAWNLPEVTLHMRLATDAQVEEVCALDLGHRVFIPSLPAGAPVPDVHAQVLGYTEHLSSQEWALDLHLAPIVTPVVGG
jgi:hypothetical protein